MRGAGHGVIEKVGKRLEERRVTEKVGKRLEERRVTEKVGKRAGGAEGN